MAQNLDLGSLSLHDRPSNSNGPIGSIPSHPALSHNAFAPYQTGSSGIAPPGIPFGGGPSHLNGGLGSGSSGGSSALYSSGDLGAFRAPGSGHVRGMSANGSLGGAGVGLPGGEIGNPGSASARFERFFAPNDPPTSSPISMGPPGGNPFGNAYPQRGMQGNSGGPFGVPVGSGPPRRTGTGGSGSGRNGGMSSQWGPPHAQLDVNSSTGFSSDLPIDDEVIPTAIVIKNIPFSIKRDQLLGLMEELTIPMPYAFNYHFDQGMFRGLAFANFRSPEEADAVVAALNGFDVSGRKLKVEYKKVLQAGEKERIEKEKAIKRMQSMQLEKEREKRRQEDSLGMPPMPNQAASLQQQYGAFGSGSGDSRSPIDGANRGLRVPLTAEALRGVSSSSSDGSPNGPQALSDVSGGHTGNANNGTGASGGSNSHGRRDELDLNEPGTLEIYSRVLLFKDDRMRDELSFSKSLSPMERRTVHLVAQKLGLYHHSLGEGEERCVIVSKNELPQGHRVSRRSAGRSRSLRRLTARAKLTAAPDASLDNRPIPAWRLWQQPWPVGTRQQRYDRARRSADEKVRARYEAAQRLWLRRLEPR